MGTTTGYRISTNFGWQQIPGRRMCLHEAEHFRNMIHCGFITQVLAAIQTVQPDFRKYQGNGERTLLFDCQDKQHLLQPNKTYFIQLVVYNGTTKVFVDGEQYFSFTDDEPLTEGYFGFRTVESHQEIDDFKVYRLK